MLNGRQFVIIRPMRKDISRIWVAILIIVAFLAGIFAHAMSQNESDRLMGLSELNSGKPATASFEPFWKAWNVLNDKYVRPDEISNQDRVWGAIQGLAASFDDPYTVFLPPEDSKIFEEDISGNFEGVGMEVGIRENVLTIIAPLKGSPAEEAGIRPGDKILEIDGTSTVDLTIDEAVKMIRGEGGTEVALSIVREGLDEALEISITRDVIEIPTIETELRDDGIFVIRLFNFNANSSDLFRDGLQEFIDSGSEKLILDLRNNPGGFLGAAVDITSWFLPAGKVVVIENFGPNQKERIHRSKGYDVFNENLEMALLINEGSASASEIVAGALQEHQIATLIGAQTFGKGSVQELIPITSKTALKVTVAEWLTPEGNSISEGGLTPDIEVEMTLEDFEAESDPQLDRAVDYLQSR